MTFYPHPGAGPHGAKPVNFGILFSSARSTVTNSTHVLSFDMP